MTIPSVYANPCKITDNGWQAISWDEALDKVAAGEMNANARCTAQLHPQDAQRFDITQGQQISVTSRVGDVTLAVDITDKIMPGVISIPHGGT